MLDASVAIAALSLPDPLHERALGLIAELVDEHFVLHAVTRAEVLVAPVRAAAPRSSKRNSTNSA